MPWLNVDFWHILQDADNEHFDFLTLLRQLSDLPANQRLLDRGVEYSDFLEVPQFQEGQVFAEATRGRKVNLPGRLNVVTGVRGDLGVYRDEAVDEAVHFLYDGNLRVLATQRQVMFRASAVGDLLRTLGNANFHLSAVLRQDKWNRVNRMENIGKIEIGLQGPDHHPDFSGVMPSLNQMMDESAERMNAIAAELTLTMKHSRRSLNASRIKGLVNRLRRQDNLDKLKVSGKAEGAERAEIVDFMNDRLVFSERVEYRGRNVSAQQCQQILRRAMDHNRVYLSSLL